MNKDNITVENYEPNSNTINRCAGSVFPDSDNNAAANIY